MKKAFIKVPSFREIPVRKAGLESVYLKHKELGIRIKKDEILERFNKRLQEIANESYSGYLTDVQAYEIWEKYEKKVLNLTTEYVIDQIGFELPSLLKPSLKAKR